MCENCITKAEQAEADAMTLLKGDWPEALATDPAKIESLRVTGRERESQLKFAIMILARAILLRSDEETSDSFILGELAGVALQSELHNFFKEAAVEHLAAQSAQNN